VEKIVDIFQSIAYEKGLKEEDVANMVKLALIDMAKHTLGEDLIFEIEIDSSTKKVFMYQKIEVLDNIKEKYEKYEIPIKEAVKIDPNIKVGDYLDYEIELEHLGRTASNYLYDVLEDRIKSLIDDKLYIKYLSRINTIISGNVSRVDDRENTHIELGDVDAILLQKNRIKGEVFKRGDAITTLIKSVEKSHYGIVVKLSRTAPKFLEELVKLESLEVQDGQIEIKKCARIPGKRAKLAVLAHDDVDPIGSIVGVKGVRIRAVGEALNGESIDCIEYSEHDEIFLTRVLSPAVVKKLTLDKENKIADVFVAPEEKSKAIGAGGINIRLASMLSGYEINLHESDEKVQETSIDELENLFK